MATPASNRITPDWLTTQLRAAGYSVTVSKVEITKAHSSNVSTIHHLIADYAEGGADISRQLLLKIPRADFAWGNREIQFYHEIVPQMEAKYTHLPFVHCYDSGYNPRTGQSHLLLEDLSATHFTYDQQTPTREHYHQVITGLALFHAYWWEHVELGARFGHRLTAAEIVDSEQSAVAALPQLFAFLAEQKQVDQQDILRRVASTWPSRRRERVLNGHGITLVHRDLHRLNFLYPREAGSVRIIDWQSWRIDTGTDDLAYMMACHWDEAQRAELEVDLLRRYCDCLVELGVTNYQWEDCRYDYQASIVRCLFFLIRAWNLAGQEAKWERIERGLLAFNQWQCAEILE